MTFSREPGELVAARYRVERVLGVGGVGVVVAATHLALEQAVSIEFLLPRALMHPHVVTRSPERRVPHCVYGASTWRASWTWGRSISASGFTARLSLSRSADQLFR